MSEIAAFRATGVHGHSPGVVLRSLVIGLTAFLTVVDLFATQAILPSLTRHYGVSPAAMGLLKAEERHLKQREKMLMSKLSLILYPEDAKDAA